MSNPAPYLSPDRAIVTEGGTPTVAAAIVAAYRARVRIAIAEVRYWRELHGQCGSDAELALVHDGLRHAEISLRDLWLYYRGARAFYAKHCHRPTAPARTA